MYAGTITIALIAAFMLAIGPAKAQQRPTFDIGGQLKLAHDNFGGLHSDSGERRSATYLRRARLGATWRPVRDWRLGAELDIDGEGKVTLRSAAVDWRGLADTTLTFGRFDPDFGLEQAISSKWTTASERSAAWDLLPGVAESLDGIGLQLAHASNRYYVSAGVFDKPDAGSLLARAVFAPWAASGRVLHLGLSLASEDIDAGGDGRIRSRLGVRGVSEHGDGNRVTLAAALKKAGANPFDRERSRALEFAVASGPYSLQAEALQRELSGSGGQRVARGQYLQLAWTVTGQARPYSIDGAKFKAIEPVAGSGGAWELFYRHDRLAVYDAAPAPSTARVHTLGVNWYATAALRLSLSGSSARSDTTVNDAGDNSGQALGLRVQVVF